MEVLNQLSLSASSTSRVRLWGRTLARAMSKKSRLMIISNSGRSAS